MESKISPKKRKSPLSKTETPSKLPKIAKGIPKVKTPKQENTQSFSKADNTPAKKKGKQKKNAEETSEQNTTPENVKLNGSSKKDKLKKFKGIKSLSEEKTEKNDSSPKKEGSKSRHHRLLEKMKEVNQKEGLDVAVKSLNAKIDAILSRPEVTKTGKKKIKYYKHLIKSFGGEVSTSTETIIKKINEENKAEFNKKKSDKNAKNKNDDVKKPTPNPKGKKAEKIVKEEDSDDDDDDDEESAEETTENVEEESDEDEEESDEEESLENEEAEDDDSSEQEESDDEEVEEEEEKPKQKQPVKKQEIKKDQNFKQEEKKTRHVLFIGNLAYTTTKEELKQHFVNVGEVIDVRIPTDKLSNKPRGFAYVELSDKAAFQKALELNGSQLNNRRIKVEFQDGQKKNNSFNNKQKPPFNKKNMNFNKGGRKFGK